MRHRRPRQRGVVRAARERSGQRPSYPPSAGGCQNLRRGVLLKTEDKRGQGSLGGEACVPTAERCACGSLSTRTPSLSKITSSKAGQQRTPLSYTLTLFTRSPGPERCASRNRRCRESLEGLHRLPPEAG